MVCGGGRGCHPQKETEQRATQRKAHNTHGKQTTKKEHSKHQEHKHKEQSVRQDSKQHHGNKTPREGNLWPHAKAGNKQRKQEAETKWREEGHRKAEQEEASKEKGDKSKRRERANEGKFNTLATAPRALLKVPPRNPKLAPPNSAHHPSHPRMTRKPQSPFKAGPQHKAANKSFQPKRILCLC